jgi:membrane protease subunit HflC
MSDYKKIIDQLVGLKTANGNREPLLYKTDKQPSKQNYMPILITGAVIIFLFITVLSNLYIVKPNEYKVVRQFGEVVKVIEEPGLNYKLPFIQSVTTLPKHLLIYDVTPAEINTFDKKRIMVDHYAIWKITDPQQMIESLRSVQAAEGRLGDIIYSNIRTELGRLNYDEIINEEKSSRGNINELVLAEVNAILSTNSNGIELLDLHMKRTDLPASNEQAVFNRMISERESTAQEYLSQGDAEANIIRAQTDREAQEMLAVANAEAKVIIADGDGEAARIYNEAYGQDPDFFSMYRTLESYRETLKNEPVMIIPIDSPYAKYLLGE